MRKFLKYLILSMLLAPLALPDASAQHYFGVRGGIGSGSARFYPQQEMGTVWGLWSGGVSWKFYTSEPFVGGIEIDAILMQQGYRHYRKDIMESFFPGQQDTTGYRQRTVNTLMVPIFWQPHIYMFKQRLRIFINLGLTFSYNISSREEIGSRIHGIVQEGEYVMKTTRDNRLGYGLCGGGGISWIRGRFEFFAECRYYFGYADILKNRNKYEENPLRSPMDGLQFALGAYWKLGRDPIRSHQNRPADEEIQRIQERRASRREAKGEGEIEGDSPPGTDTGDGQETGTATRVAEESGESRSQSAPPREETEDNRTEADEQMSR